MCIHVGEGVPRHHFPMIHQTAAMSTECFSLHPINSGRNLHPFFVRHARRSTSRICRRSRPHVPALRTSVKRGVNERSRSHKGHFCVASMSDLKLHRLYCIGIVEISSYAFRPRYPVQRRSQRRAYGILASTRRCAFARGASAPLRMTKLAARWRVSSACNQGVLCRRFGDVNSHRSARRVCRSLSKSRRIQRVSCTRCSSPIVARRRLS